MYSTNMRIDAWAKSKGLLPVTVYRVISRQIKRGKSTDKVRKAVSADTGKSVVELWPETADTQ